MSRKKRIINEMHLLDQKREALVKQRLVRDSKELRQQYAQLNQSLADWDMALANLIESEIVEWLLS